MTNETRATSTDEVRWLTEEWLDGDISDPDALRLHALLREDPSAVQIFVDHVDLRMSLEFGEGRLAESHADELVSVAVARSGSGTLRRRAGAAVLLGACVIALFAFVAFPRTEPAEIPQPLVAAPVETARAVAARVDAALGGVRRTDADPLGVGSDLFSGDELTVDENSRVRLHFRNGATLLVDGPAAVSLINPDRATLSRGQLVATIPREAIGFYLELPGGGIRDLGTRFAAAVDGRISHVTVVKGLVACEVDSETGGSERHLLEEGEAASINADRRRFLRQNSVPPELDQLIASTFGITRIDGDARFVSSTCRSPWDARSLQGDQAVIFAERQQVLLDEDLELDVSGPSGETQVRRGDRVDAFLVRFDPVDVPGADNPDIYSVEIQCVIDFARPILGVIRSLELLHRTDVLFAPTLLAEDWEHQSPEVRKRRSSDEQGDEVSIDASGRTLTIRMRVAEMPAYLDELRVVVAADENAAAGAELEHQ